MSVCSPLLSRPLPVNEKALPESRSYIPCFGCGLVQIIEHKPYNRKADMFSFGVVLWELLTGKVRQYIISIAGELLYLG